MASDRTVQRVLSELLDLEETELSLDRPLASLEGWDSVNALRVLLFLEREAGRALDYQRFAEARCVQDLVDLTANASPSLEGPGR